MFRMPVKKGTRASGGLPSLLGLLLLVALSLNGGWQTPRVGAETAATQGSISGELTVEAVRERIDRLEKSPEIDEATKARMLALYQLALQDLTSVEKSEAKAREFGRVTQTAVEVIDRTKADLAAYAPRSQPAIPIGATTRQLEKALAKAEAALATATQTLASAEVEPRRRATRRLEIRRLLKDARKRATELERRHEGLASEKDADPLDMAQRIRLQAAYQAVVREIESYDQELATYEATADLLPLNHDLAAREAGQAKAAVQELKQRVSQAQRLEAEDDVRQARLKAAMVHPTVRDLAAANEQLARQRHDLIDEVERNTGALSRARKALARLEKDFERIKDKVQAVGRTNAIGLLLRTQRAALPSTHDYLQAIKLRQEKIRAAHMQVFQLEERRAELAAMEQNADNVLDDFDEGGGIEEQEDRDYAVRDLRRTQKQYVDLLSKECYRHLETLVELDIAEREVVAKINSYRDYIDEHVLWIRSASPIWDVSKWRLDSVLRSFRALDFWKAPVKILVVDFQTHLLLWLAALPVLMILFFARRRARVSIREVGEWAGVSTMQRFLPTARISLLTMLLAIPVFAVLAFLAWRISASMEASEAAKALAAGLWAVMLIYFPMEFFRQTCRPSGLAERHFDWPVSAVSRLHRSLSYLILLTLPFALIAATLNARQAAGWRDSLGRVCFIAGLCLVACGAHRLLRRRSEVSRAFLADQPDGWLPRALLVGYFLGVAVPMLLAAVAALGYYFTAWHFALRWLRTLRLVLGLVILGSFFLRWILVIRRRLATDRARSQREQTLDAETAAPEDGAASETAGPSLADEEPDLTTINAQARRVVYILLSVAAVLGLWLIWADVIPALGILHRVPLWQAVDRTVTLADVAWAALVAVLTYVAARNIPGLLQISLLQHLSIDKGLRYAIITVCRYLFVGVGVVWMCNLVGLTWGKVQWILAAMSVGLGFGLQEIFANFVSGMVILFERPIRLGDIITIGDATGRVTKIQMRATTIQDWDRKELVVPNKEFVTGRLLNWTLTDNVNRLVIEVGVAYNSDPDQVREVLLRIAREHPKVLDDPKPIAIFKEFGASALIFSLRVYLSTMRGRLEVIHEMHAAVHRALREAGIEIAYPQLDLHVRPPNNGGTAVTLRSSEEKVDVSLPTD